MIVVNLDNREHVVNLEHREKLALLAQQDCKDQGVLKVRQEHPDNGENLVCLVQQVGPVNQVPEVHQAFLDQQDQWDHKVNLGSVVRLVRPASLADQEKEDNQAQEVRQGHLDQLAYQDVLAYKAREDNVDNLEYKAFVDHLDLQVLIYVYTYTEMLI